MRLLYHNKVTLFLYLYTLYLIFNCILYMRNPVKPMEMPNNLEIANILAIKALKSLKQTIEITEPQILTDNIFKCMLLFLNLGNIDVIPD